MARNWGIQQFRRDPAVYICNLLEPKFIQTPTLLDFSIHGWLRGSIGWLTIPISGKIQSVRKSSFAIVGAKIRFLEIGISIFMIVFQLIPKFHPSSGAKTSDSLTKTRCSSMSNANSSPNWQTLVPGKVSLGWTCPWVLSPVLNTAQKPWFLWEEPGRDPGRAAAR